MYLNILVKVLVNLRNLKRTMHSLEGNIQKQWGLRVMLSEDQKLVTSIKETTPPDNLLGSLLDEVSWISSICLPSHLLPIPEVVSIITTVVKVGLCPQEKAIVTIKASVLGPVVLVTETKMPFTNNMGGVTCPNNDNVNEWCMCTIIQQSPF